MAEQNERMIFSTGFKPLPTADGFPSWLKFRCNSRQMSGAMGGRILSRTLHTVCEEAACPNIGHCWKHGHATIMILGPHCSRHCRFCNVSKESLSPPDPLEPEYVAESIAAGGLKEAVITSVTRDDLPDGGASHWAATVHAIHEKAPGVKIEVLVPDFLGDKTAIKTVLDVRPDIFGHNVETVPRLYPSVRPEAEYVRSLDVLRYAAEAGFITKTSLMLGLGETDDEIYGTLKDIRSAGVKIVFMGQYLRPTSKHIAVAGFLSPEHFAALGEAAKSLGFEQVEAAPNIRSSYKSVF